MNVDTKEFGDTLAVLAHVDLLVFLVNLERRVFLDTQGHEVLLVLTDLLALQDGRDL